MTWPPKASIVAAAVEHRAPSTKSRTAPRWRARGPDRPAATMPPTVAAGAPKCGGSKARHWPLVGQRRFEFGERRAARAVTTSSLGS